jgi:hypothetical protein
MPGLLSQFEWCGSDIPRDRDAEEVTLGREIRRRALIQLNFLPPPRCP